jgi:hypothetical protein
MNIKWILAIMMGVFFIALMPKSAEACEIEIEVTKGKKENYQVGDTLVLLVKVALTHRSCPIKMKETKFNMKGLKVLKSTPWKQKASNDWERKLMVVVKETKGGKLNLAAVRECEKDGGFGSIKLDVVQ